MTRPTLAWRRVRFPRAIYRHLILWCATLAGASITVDAAQSTAATPLSPGAPVERELSGGQSHAYEMILDAGQFLRLTVEQKGVDIVLKLIGPGGQTLAEVDSPNGKGGIEPLPWVTTEAGRYQVLVVCPGRDDPPGKYTVTLHEVRAAGPRDAARSAAERARTEAELLFGSDKAEDQRRARQLYEQALTFFRESGESRSAAESLRGIAFSSYRLGDHKRAEEALRQSLPLWREAGDRHSEVETLSNLGGMQASLGESQEALATVEQSLTLLRELKDAEGEAAALNTLATIHLSLGDVQRGLEHLDEGLAIARRPDFKDRGLEITILVNLAQARHAIGETQTALDYGGQALRLARETKTRRQEAAALRALSEFLSALGEYQTALEYGGQALKVVEETGDRRAAAIILNDIGLAHYWLGNHAQAVEFYQRSLPLAQEAGNRLGMATTLRNLGISYVTLGDQERGRAAFAQALPLFRAVGDRPGEAAMLITLGGVFAQQGDHQKASEQIQLGLQLSRQIKFTSQEAYALAYLAETERARGDLPAALSHFAEALRLTEALRARVAGPELRSSFLASVQGRYEAYIDALMEAHAREPGAGHAATALHVAEQARARGLLDLLNEAGAGARGAVDPGLTARERALRQQLNAQAARETRMLSGKHTAAQAAALSGEVAALAGELKEVETRIRQTDPRYASLTQPQPLTAPEIQQLLDPDTVLLEFALGERRSWLWAVTGSTIASFPLPPRREIDAAARQTYELLTARQPKTGMDAAQHRALVAQSDAQLEAATAALGRLLLGQIGPRLDQEWKGKRLIVVASGALAYLPFASLPLPGGESPSPRLLISGHEIVNLPSASVLAVTRRETAGRRAAAKAIAVIADPVFDVGDPRVAAAARKETPGKSLAANVRSAGDATPAANTDLARAAGSFGRAGFSRLPFSREEAAAIASLAPRSSALQATDFKASRATAQSGVLSDYRLIHFATHGLLNSAHPELSGIVLSLVDERGQVQDGFLRLHEIYGLRLAAEVVVLSACQTALGKEVRGEGLVGLTRGFMYAGAPRVVASLWQVDDLATAELMKRLYHGMLKDGLRPAAALRAAQQELAREKRWSAPYFWAGFVLQGEWR